MKEYAYLIYQLKDPMESNYAWMSWKTAKREFNPVHYDGVYYGHIEGNTSESVLEKLFEKFNMNQPDDFKGHSLSVSDVVVLFDHNGCKWYYCDRFGWENITRDIMER